MTNFSFVGTDIFQLILLIISVTVKIYDFIYELLLLRVFHDIFLIFSLTQQVAFSSNFSPQL